MVRFTVGPQAAGAGIVAGDKIVAIYGLPLLASMPANEETLAPTPTTPLTSRWAICCSAPTAPNSR